MTLLRPLLVACAAALSLPSAVSAGPALVQAPTKQVHATAPVRRVEIDCRPCGAPAECQMDPKQAEKLRAAKKRIMLHDYPARIVNPLINPLPQCEMCVWGPDAQTVEAGVTIVDVHKNGNWKAMSWTKENELISRHELKKGITKAFYFVHQAEACTCCSKSGGKWTRPPPPDQRKDWDKHLGINKDAAVKFEKVSDLGPEPADLKDAANRDALK